MERRRRRIACGCLTLSFLVVVTPQPCEGFTALSRGSAVKRPLRRTSVVLYESALVLEPPTSPSSSVNTDEYEYATPKTHLPPWLKRLEGYTEDDAMIHLDWLEYALLEENFTFDDVGEIIQAVKETSRGDVPRLVGVIDFLRLILQLKDDGDDMFCTKQVLLASVLHFSECITVRETGVYELVRRAVHGRQHNGNYRALAPAREQSRADPEAETYDDITRSLISATRRQELYSEAFAEYGEEVTRIARDAARVKRAEILAHTVLDVGRKPSKEEASRLRGLLLSVMDDWRALAIRAAACLYRLDGILYDSERGAAEYVDLSQETVKVTREALHVYAPLAQRLGMQRLKAKLEDRSFRIMYRRQYDVVSSLYEDNGQKMALVSSGLSSRIEQVLRQTPSLMDQLEDLKVTSRVKEPYSLWKKLLKLRSREAKSLLPSLEGSTERLVSSTKTTPTPSELSLLDVQDGIAIRVILTARKWSPDEPEETTRAREALLCYYVQHVLRNYWPEIDTSRVKDYIRFPKPNGYQSLHYTSAINSEGQTWPFEVQVRSEEMHRIAEYGVAAHWDYKLGNKKIELLAPSEKEVRPLQQSDVDPVGEELDDGKTTVAEDSYIDALVTAREDLVQQKVFVFFAGSSAIDNVGQLLSLPVGARVSDAISELKDQLDLDMDVERDDGSVLRNGRTAKLEDFIGNGDVLLITV